MTRVGVDATPLIGARTGVGVYTARLLEGLAGGPADVVASAFTWRGRQQLSRLLPDEVQAASRPVPARVLRRLWQWSDIPTVERLAGPLDLFHATNFVLPPMSACGVLTIHDLAYLKFPTSVHRASLAYRELVPRSLQRSAVVCTPSLAVAEQVRDAYPGDPARVVVTPLGVDASWYLARPASATLRGVHGINADYMLALGTIEPRKNLGALLSAYRSCIRQGIDIPQLVLVGGRGWGAGLDIDGLPPGSVVRTGRLKDAEVQSLVAGATLMAFPSLDEGFGLPPLEALACGVPVVSNDLTVTREVLGDQAAFCDATDAESLADALVRALQEPPGDPQGRRARATRFTWAGMVEATLRAYEMALS